MGIVGSFKILHKILYPPPISIPWKEGTKVFDREFDLMTRKKITLKYAKLYRKTSSKKEKSLILSEFVHLTGYNRSYASWLLRNAGRRIYLKTPNGHRVVVVADPRRKIKRKRRRIYDDEVLAVLIKIWRILDYPCSLRLKVMLPRMIEKLEAYGELNLNDSVKEKLRRISRATIDRLLSPVRKRMELKPRAKTKPGSLLKKQIAIRTHSDWDEDIPGFIEIDLISHDGGYLKGEFAYTLVLTDISTQWTEIIPVRNRAAVWTFEGLKEAIKRFPFVIKGIDSDNDSAFINHHLYRWCKEKGIVFTRSRPYWKNDNCHVEQKNWSIGRRYFGYFRYDTPKALEVMKELSEVISYYVNYFQPSVKLAYRVREGSRIKRVYELPRTPYERVFMHRDVPDEVRERVEEVYKGLNPAELHRKIERLRRRLYSLATPVKGVYYE